MHVATPPDTERLLSELDPNRLSELLRSEASEDGTDYVHWDKLRHMAPPDGLSREEWWLLIKVSRRTALLPLPLRDAEGSAFVYGTPDVVQRLLHYVDQRCSGEIAMPEVVTADD